jgi:hypothetical protein
MYDNVRLGFNLSAPSWRYSVTTQKPRYPISGIKKLWIQEFGHDFENKSNADYSKLAKHERIDQAINRSEKHKNDPSWTHIHLVMKDILS